MVRLSFPSAQLLAVTLGWIILIDCAHAAHTTPPPQLTFTRHLEDPPPPSVNRVNLQSNSARRELATITQTLRRQFETSAEYVAAIGAEMAAWQQYQDASRAILTKLRTSVDYKARQIDLQNAEQRLEDARHDPGGKLNVSVAAQRAADARTALRKLENDALARDESVAQARQTYLNCAHDSQSLRQQFQTGLTADPQWRDARARLDAPR